jgi:hypothetical protein
MIAKQHELVFFLKKGGYLIKTTAGADGDSMKGLALRLDSISAVCFEGRCVRIYTGSGSQNDCCYETNALTAYGAKEIFEIITETQGAEQSPAADDEGRAGSEDESPGRDG